MLDVQIFASPLASASKRISAGFIVADQLGDFFTGGGGDGGFISPELAAINPTISLDWAATPLLAGLQNIGFAQFLSDGNVRLGAGPREKNARAGVYILPREVPLDSQIGANSDVLSNGNTANHWIEDAGTWITGPGRVPRGGGGGTAIINRGSDETARARTAGVLPANRCLRFDLDFAGLKRSGPQPGFRLRWGEQWSFVFRHGEKVSIQRRGFTPAGLPQWLKIKTINAFPNANLFGGHYQVYLLRLDGRLLFGLEGKNGGSAYVWIFDSQLPENSVAGGAGGSAGAAGPVEPVLKDFSWAAAPLLVSAFNVRVRLEVAVVKWSLANGDLLTAILDRLLKRKTPITSAGTATMGGWQREGATATVTSAVEENTVSWRLTMTGSPDGLATPFVDRVQLRYTPAWTNPVPQTLNLRPAARTLNLSLALPPTLAGAEASAEFDRGDLDALCPGWQQNTLPWCPVSIRVKYRGENHSRLFRGRVFKPSKDSHSPGDRPLKITFRDPIVQLQKIGMVNMAPVDHRYPPGDILFAEKFLDSTGATGGYGLDGAPVPPGVLYTAEVIQETARIALGNHVADTMNGNGDPLRFLPPGHPPLFSLANDRVGLMQLEGALGGTNALTGSGFLLPPPFGDDVFSWWSKLAGDDRCIFYFGWPAENAETEPILMYGRYLQLIQSAVVRRVYDADYGGTSIQKLILDASTEYRPERDFNRVLVWAKEQPGLEGLLPALRMSEHRLPASDPRSAEKSFERTLIIRETIALLAAEAIGANVIAQMAGVNLQFPSFTLRGDERWRPNDILLPVMDGDGSDPSFGLHNQAFRAERIDHRFDFSAGDDAFKTTISPRVLSKAELQRLQRLQLLGVL